MADEDLKKLPPEERIKRLKELEQKRKKEIEDAQKQIRESEQELTERKKWKDKVPIPEATQVDSEGLSEEGKQLLKVHKGKAAPKKDAEEEKESPRPMGKASRLEETVTREKIDLPPQAMGMEYGATSAPSFTVAYQPLRERPIAEVYQEMGSLKQAIEEKGYVSRADERKAEYLSGIAEERIKSSEQGKYSFTEETARAASLTQMLGSTIQQAYGRKDKGSVFEHDWYKGR